MRRRPDGIEVVPHPRNPNVLTADVGTSRLAQGCTGQLASVEVERYDGPPPPIRCFDPPGN